MYVCMYVCMYVPRYPGRAGSDRGVASGIFEAVGGSALVSLVSLVIKGRGRLFGDR